MNIFDILTLFGGLAMFLYGMRLMGDGLKESSSGAMKKAMEAVTNNPVKAFLLGAAVTAVIQSSTATIVITSGLVAAGIISLQQSLGIIVGANVGTTITGQIIRLLDLDSSAAGFLQLLRPSTLAPVALIAGIILIMGFHFKNSKSIGNIAIGFGILFTGLMNMTGAVDSLAETGIFENMFTGLGNNPVLGYLTGAAVSFILQSSSAAVGILQAFSASGRLTFKAIYSVIVGIYLGDCVTTAIVCSIGAKADARRVGAFNILYNLCKSAAVFIFTAVLKQIGLLDGIWNQTANTGFIANTNTIFNLGSAVLLFPLIGTLKNLAVRIVKDDPSEENKYKEKLDALNPNFVQTPAIALNSCYELLMTMFCAVRENITAAVSLFRNFDESAYGKLMEEEDNIDLMADSLGDYLALLSASITDDYSAGIMNQYYKLGPEFERMGDYAVNMSETALDLHKKNISFSPAALQELGVLKDLLFRVIDTTELAVRKRDLDAAYSVEPLEEVVDDIVLRLKNRHMERLAKGECNVYAGTDFMTLLTTLERVSDICSDAALSVLMRVNPDMANQVHDYVYYVHSGKDERFNREYHAACEEYFSRLNAVLENNTVQK